MPAPIFNLPIHTIEQARALAGLLRAFIDDQCPSDNDGEDWKPDPEFEGICAIAAHLDAGIASTTETDAQYKARHAEAVKANSNLSDPDYQRQLRESRDALVGPRPMCGGTLAYEVIGQFRISSDGVYRAQCMKCRANVTNDGTPRLCESTT